MNLEKICEKIEYKLLRGSMDIEVADVIYDSRRVAPGTTFVCMVGAVTDGHKYIPDAIKKGATALVIQREDALEEYADAVDGADVTIILVESTRRALAYMAAAYFDYPAKKLTTVGLTGTKGKTTTTFIIQEVLNHAGAKAGLIGTIENVIGDEHIPAKNTTPESYEIHRYMHMMVEAGCKYLIMEVSSQGLKFDRTTGIEFDYGVFTNLSPDHIGPTEHPDFEDYLRCKKILFNQCKTGIFNLDDPYVEEIMEGHTCNVVTMSLDEGTEADITADNISFIKEDGMLGMQFDVHGMMEGHAKTHIPGKFSVYNALTTVAVCKCLGIEEDAIFAGLEEAQVKGRVELIPVSDQFSVIIDYAHNALSTRSVLKTLKEYNPHRLIAVFGAGGNRSKVRRYNIGEEAGKLADLCIVTTDNPRFESLSSINEDIKEGLNSVGGTYIEIDDRKEAIAYAITNAEPGDMIIMLGKGHETYIEIEGLRRHFSEHEAIWEIMDDIYSGRRIMTKGTSIL
ncbi:MAG: UDP-N-acetylmuramoyl-L-alanyl-D-glutamate--2,6-diaminopimelate ligase [Eubacterium sp.]|nr:UDP-N-acetylmuramoyl-L-alanyl-D-glutamate--2,6-diaminopimelate ligase [Candidatus Colimonas fimequi]